jgi:predicted acylesterase/phospholipase RssA
MNTGQVVVFDEETQMEIRNKALMSSASIPFVFAPVEIDGMQLIDGGTFQNVAVGDPIERCKNEEGVRDEDIIVDIILCL